jgi:hypothetical protein
MIDFTEDPRAALVEIRIEGRVTRDELEEVATRVEAAIVKHGKLRLLEEVRGFSGIEPTALWEDLKFSLRHLKDFSRCAVVTDQNWIEWFARGANPFVACDIRCFPLAEIEQARTWLKS